METTDQNKLAPTFGDSFSNGWKVMFNYFLVLLLVVIIMGIIMSPTQMFRIEYHPDRHFWDWGSGHINMLRSGSLIAFGALALLLGLIALVYSLMVVPVFRYGSRMMFVQAVRNTRPEFETLVRGFRENYLYIVLANLLVTALIMLAMIFLIIPGIIVACRLAFVSYLVMDKKLDPIIAIEESWKMTKGHGWTIFFMGFTSFFIYLAGFILLFVGILPAGIWVGSSFASLYNAVLTEKEAIDVEE
jgi:hypothetical protein